MKRGGPMKRSAMPNRKAPLEASAKAALRSSAKRPGQAAQSPRARRARPKAPGIPQDVYDAVWSRDGGRCQAHGLGFALDVPCSGRPHVHHRVLRSQGGGHTLTNLILVCEGHHHLAHDVRRAEAEASSVIIRRTSNL